MINTIKILGGIGIIAILLLVLGYVRGGLGQDQFVDYSIKTLASVGVAIIFTWLLYNLFKKNTIKK